MFVEVFKGMGEVPVLCFSLGGEESFILLSRLGGSLWIFPISMLAVGTRSFLQEKQNKSPNLWDCLWLQTPWKGNISQPWAEPGTAGSGISCHFSLPGAASGDPPHQLPASRENIPRMLWNPSEPEKASQAFGVLNPDVFWG